MHSAFQPKKNNILIENFVDSVIIIDDKEKDITELQKILESKQIWCKHYLPEVLLNEKPKLKNRKLIFLDLFIDESKAGLKDQLSLIRKIFKDSIGKSFGSYGIVLWTKHPENFEEFKAKFYQSYKSYDLPLFIVGLDKGVYLKDGFTSVLKDLQTKLLNDVGANFFINWDIAVNSSKDQSIRQIYDLINLSQDENLKYVLFQMAKNVTGIPFSDIEGYDLEHDALKSFSDLLIYNINNFPRVSYGLFAEWEEISFKGNSKETTDYDYSIKNFLNGGIKTKTILYKNVELTNREKSTQKENINILEKEILTIQSKLNKILLFDNSNLDKTKIFPGSIYKITNVKFPLILDNIPDVGYPICIEVTPPCDYAQSKFKKRRLVGGFICDYNIDSPLSGLNGSNYYTEIYPIWLDEKLKMVVFDFGYFTSLDERQLMEEDDFELVYHTKNKLFADIIQKLSAHTARLGLAIIR